jgi:hypothetical protein
MALCQCIEFFRELRESGGRLALRPQEVEAITDRLDRWSRTLSAFLHSFEPSLLYLLPALKRSAITTYQDLLTISNSWSRNQVIDFLTDMPVFMGPGAAGRLAPNIVRKLAAHLHDHHCTCAHALPRLRTCGIPFFSLFSRQTNIITPEIRDFLDT